MKLRKLFYAFSACLLLFTACDDDNEDPAIIPELRSSGVKNNEMVLEIGSEITITPEVSALHPVYEWTVNEEVVSDQLRLQYTPDEKGTYNIHFKVSNNAGEEECEYVVKIVDMTPLITSSGIKNNSLEIKIGSKVEIVPIVNTEGLEYEWKINKEVISTESKLSYTPSVYGDFIINLTVKNESGNATCDYNLTVKANVRELTEDSSPYLTSLIEYKPAPGQFMNEGAYQDPEQILGKPEYAMLSLGGFGGYISAAFDHTITKRKGKEILIFGNAFDGSSEPGIVMVSFDFNGNGIADDEWYELAGSEYNAPKTIHKYEITYTNPKKKGVDVPWTDNQGNSGVVEANQFHTANNYYPEFIEEQESVTFTGTLLENKTDLDYSNDMYQHIVYNPARDWGYTDNYSSEYDNFKGNTFDIEWAVNSKGEKISLPGVDFIKVYTATNVNAGWLGENSTEFMGAADMLLLE